MNYLTNLISNVKCLAVFAFFLFVTVVPKAYSQNWTKVSGIADGGLVTDIAIINDKIVLSATVFDSIFAGAFYISTNGGNNWSALPRVPSSVSSGLMDALPVNNIFTAFFSNSPAIQSKQLIGNTWSNFSSKYKFAEFSNGEIIGGSFYSDSVYRISSSGTVGARINSSTLSFNGDGKFFNGANNRLFLFKNGGVGIDLLGEFHYIDYSDLSSFKIPLSLDGNAMTNDDWRDDLSITGMIMMDNGDLIASSANRILIKSVDNGLNWTTLSNEFGFTPSNNLCRNSLGHIYGIIGYGRIVVSTDGGVTFTNINGNLEANIPAQSKFNSLFVNSLNEVFVILNNQEASSTIPANSGIYKLDGSTGLANVTEATRFEIFPNPTTGVFTFKNNSSSKADVSILNLVGHKVLQINTKDELTTIDLSNHAAGVYFVQTTVNGKLKTQKLIIH